MTAVSEVGPPRMEAVAEGVHAYVQPDGTWGLNNAGCVISDGEALVVDTCFTAARAERFAAAVADLTDAPVRMVVNTHHHADHTHGNYRFAPEAVIVAHRACRETMRAAGLFATSVFSGVDFGELRVALPSVTFERELTLHVGELRVELRHFGTAHTTNDIVAWIPDRGVLFAGDLAMNAATPFLAMGSLTGSIRACSELRALGAGTIVPGHGEVCGPEVIDDMVAYLELVERTSRAGWEAGLSPLQASRQVDLGRFAAWHNSERLVANIHRAYSELAGEPWGAPIDMGAVNADMEALSGAWPLWSKA